jgi:hypothetical protein
VFTLRQRALPALGKAAEVRAQLTDWAQHLQEQGRPVAVLAQLFSAEGPTLVVSTRAEDLNTLDRYRRESQTDADWQSRAARLLPLLRGPVTSTVVEVLLPMSGSGPVGIVQAVAGFPALGQERRYRETTEAFVRARQAAGDRIGMAVRVFSAIGPVVEVTSVHPDLADLDRARTARAEAARQVTQALAELSREPLQGRLFEALVPFPS